MQTTPPLRTRIKPLVLAGLSIAIVRFAAEFVAPDLGWYFGVYHLMPFVILIAGAKDAWGPVRWPLVPASMAVMCLIVWGMSQGLLTSVGGTIWCTLWGTLLIWLPARLRHRS